MPYIQRAGASQSNLLAAYIGAVRRRAGLGYYGLGDNGDIVDPTYIGSEVGGTLPDSTPLMIGPILPGQSPTDYLSALAVSPTLSTSGVTPGTCVGPGCSPSSTPDTTLSGLFAALAQGAQSGLKIFQQAQGPTMIGGVLYNPATGQYYNPTTGQVVNANGTAIAGDLSSIFSSPLLLYGGLALGGILLVSMMGHGR